MYILLLNKEKERVSVDKGKCHKKMDSLISEGIFPYKRDYLRAFSKTSSEKLLDASL